MPLLQWDSSISVGIAEFDEHHRKMLDYIHQLNEAFRQHQSQPTLKLLFKELEDYTYYHFSAEEHYMTKYKYPNFIEHKKQHQIFIEKIAEYREAVVSEKLALVVLRFLNEWYIKHIKSVDKRYKDFFIEKGLR